MPSTIIVEGFYIANELRGSEDAANGRECIYV